MIRREQLAIERKKQGRKISKPEAFRELGSLEEFDGKIKEVMDSQTQRIWQKERKVDPALTGTE